MIKTIYINDRDIVNIPLKMVRNNKNAINPVLLKPEKQKVLAFRQGNIKDEPVSEYNLYEISSAEDVDGIIRRAIQKKRALSLKSGYKFVGQNENTINYIKQRMMQISIAQDMPMELLIKNTIGDVIRYHNAFWYKVRNKNNSGGNTRMVGNKELQPVTAYFRMPPETIRIVKDIYGNPKEYIQEMPDGRTKEYSPWDIIHFKHNPRAGLSFAPPGLWPAIDDIRALRRIEENTELLIEQYLFPLFVCNIGTDQWPADVYEDGTTEVDVWTNKIENMPSSGGIVVTHRHKFSLLGFEKILPVEEYIQHFLKRAYTSAGVSNLDMGDGSGMNRATADNASKILIEDVKDYQQEFAMQFNHYVINELLLENYNIAVLNEENIVRIEFAEIDIENMVKLENHHALMYSMHAITEDELRAAIGRVPIDSSESSSRDKMFINIAGNVKNNKSKNIIANQEQPANQYGKLTGPSERKSSIIPNYFIELLVEDLRDFTKNPRDFTKSKLTNYIYSIDFPAVSVEIYAQIQDSICQIVDSIYDMYEKKRITSVGATDLLMQQLTIMLNTFNK